MSALARSLRGIRHSTHDFFVALAIRLENPVTDLREIAKRIYLATMKCIEPGPLVLQKLRCNGRTLVVDGTELDLDSYREVVLVGMGKASIKLGAAVEEILGDRVTSGILVTDRGTREQVRSEVIVAGHPLPDANSLLAGEKLTELVRSCAPDSLIIFLISGGGSALVELPVSPSISLADLRATNKLLVGCGASIAEINLIRKFLSRIKGGRLGYLAKDCTSIALYLSDVNAGDLLSIASNPLLPEKLEATEVLDVIDMYDLMDRFPSSVADVIRKGADVEFDREWEH